MTTSRGTPAARHSRRSPAAHSAERARRAIVHDDGGKEAHQGRHCWVTSPAGATCAVSPAPRAEGSADGDGRGAEPVSDVAVRPYRQDDFGALQRLFRRAFESELPEELWRWKYERSPFRHLGVVGEKDGLVVAYYGGWVWRIRGAGRVLEALALNDTMTDPAVRMAGRHPILVPLHESVLSLAREQGVGWYGGFPNARAARFGSRFLGYRYERLLRLQASAESLVAPPSPALSVTIGRDVRTNARPACRPDPRPPRVSHRTLARRPQLALPREARPLLPRLRSRGTGRPRSLRGRVDGRAARPARRPAGAGRVRAPPP